MAKKEFDLKDVLDKVEDIVENLSKDKDLKKQFDKNPAKAIEKILL